METINEEEITQEEPVELDEYTPAFPNHPDDPIQNNYLNQ